MTNKQVKCKTRVADHGEVFTHEREVNAMLDLVKQETERIDSRFLEPACGTGNFLAEVLNRKLNEVENRYKKNQLDFERYAIIALSSIYGIDIMDKMQILDLYRISEFENIQKAFKQFFGVDFEIDHAEALLNGEKQGDHHPDNLQLLLKYHNGKKNKNSWKRFTLDEQIDYIKQTISLQSLVADKFDVEIDQKILESLINRLKEVY